ncbi:TolC family outer membrane protein [Motilimonas cestriensis]|uniref:TolC family outer membrane protein n=1 Tax=Motilimonas cestriensis TaxID=2742685 RepID=A0ABS8WG32_9GAMM|nr:TolC family outer membrane protein [Motilimonas cestriensis]MCE2596539.1 TolC family outer membrane protein [Motilimonas cestriensis]
MKKTFFSTVLAAGFIISASGHAETLESSVAKTLVSNPEINRVLSRVGAFQKANDGAFAGYLPTIDINAGIGRERTDRDNFETTTYTRKELGLSLRQILFNGFATGAEYDRTAFEANAEQYALLADAEDISLKTITAYLNVLKSSETLSLAEQNLEIHQKIYTDIKKRTDSGIGSTSDLSQIESRLARSNANMMNAENNLSDAETQYLRLVNEYPENLEVPQPDFSSVPNSFADIVQRAMDNHPRLKSSRQDIYAANAQHEVAKSKYYPEVALEVESNFLEDADGTLGRNDELVGMVRMRYNLFNGGKDQAYVDETAFQVNEAKHISEGTLRDLHQGARLSWDAKRFLEQQQRFLEKHVVASEQTRNAYGKQFNLGKRTLLDVLNTETELFEAKKDLIATRYEVMEANYRILNSMGSLLASLRIAPPEDWRQQLRDIQ